MYKNYKEMQCLICNKVIEETFFNLLSKNKCLCFECENQFKIRNERFFIEGIECFILYYYDSFFRELLYKYKGCYDYVLKDCFLLYNASYIKKKYKGYSILLAPSSAISEKERGFNHLEEIFKSLEMPIIKCFKKSCEWKQSEKKLLQRANIQKVIKIDKSMLKGVKKVLIVDDVLTSGSTIRTMIKQIPTNIDKKALVLSSNCRVLANENI